MTLSAQLWSENADLVADVLANPFVRGIGDGTLERELFAGYLAQDAFFLESFARAYALALARSDDTATLRLHAGYAASGGIDMAGVKPAAATLAYTEFLLATAATGGLGVVCAAMTPCMRLYAHIGSTLDEASAGPYAQWVQTYADPGFEEVAALLERLLDRHGEDSPAVRDAYRRAMRLELAFFTAALTP